MSWLADTRRVLHWEADLLRRFPRLRWSVAGVLFVPALYALIYLSSVWDPASHTQALPVGVVNLDTGARYREHDVNLGTQVLEALWDGAQFDYRRYDDPAAARRDVRNGTLDFVLQIPADFSQRAVPGEAPGAARMLIYTSEGNNYTGAGFAKRFAPELAARVNAMLNEARWSLVLETAAGSQRSLESLHDAVSQLAAGATELHDGARRAREAASAIDRGLGSAEPMLAKLQAGALAASDGGTQLVGGLRHLGGGLRAIEARRPSDAELAALRSGASGLAEGHRELARSLESAQAGALRLDEGLAQLREGADEIPLFGARVVDVATQLRDGAGELAMGLGRLREGQARLAAGAQRLDEGVFLLADGLQRTGQTIAALVARLPEDARLDAFQAGLRELAGGASAVQTGLRPLATGSVALSGGLGRLEDGAARLAVGLSLVGQSLPGALDAPGGSAQGLAASVEPVVQIEAPVPNHGTALTPNFVPLALWVGAVMTGFLFQFRRIAAPVADASRSAQLLGKLALPALVVLAQAALMLLMMAFALDVEVPQPWTFGLILTTASWTFLAIVFALVRFFGDLGKVFAVLLLIVQIGAAGALMPIQLSGELFQALHPFLPLTWVVKAFRASLFGAYDGEWLAPWALVVAIGAGALLLAGRFGRWRVVEPAAWRPALDLD